MDFKAAVLAAILMLAVEEAAGLEIECGSKSEIANKVFDNISTMLKSKDILSLTTKPPLPFTITDVKEGRKAKFSDFFWMCDSHGPLLRFGVNEQYSVVELSFQPKDDDTTKCLVTLNLQLYGKKRGGFLAGIYSMDFRQTDVAACKEAVQTTMSNRFGIKSTSTFEAALKEYYFRHLIEAAESTGCCTL